MPTGEKNLFFGPQVRLRHHVAASPAFQTLVGATGSEAEKHATALARTYPKGVADPSAARPFCLVDAGAEFAATRTSTSSYGQTGSLWMMLEADVPTDKTSHAAAGQWFDELLGNLIKDMMDRAVSIDPGPMDLFIRSISLYDGPPARSDPADAATCGDFIQVILNVEWGLL